LVYRFCKKEYIRIRNPQGGGVDISSVSGKKPGDHKDSTQGHCIIARPGPKPILNVLIIRGGKSYEGKGAPVQKRSEVRSKS
jgi:hypothetical protein